MSSLTIKYFQSGVCSERQLLAACGLMRPNLGIAAKLYPRFDSWFELKAVQGLLLNERSLVFVNYGMTLAGFAILKHSQSENKICTFCVLPEYRGRGVGSRLMEACLKRFNYAMPVITVAEQLQNKFRPLLKNFGFGHPLVFFEKYRSGAAEYVYDPSRKILPVDGSGYYYCE